MKFLNRKTALISFLLLLFIAVLSCGQFSLNITDCNVLTSITSSISSKASTVLILIILLLVALSVLTYRVSWQKKNCLAFQQSRRVVFSLKHFNLKLNKLKNIIKKGIIHPQIYSSIGGLVIISV